MRRKPARKGMPRGLSRLWDRLRGGAGSVAGQLAYAPDRQEPIDFSAPSIPYYADLAARFSLARIVLYMILLVFVTVTVISSRQFITYSNLYYLVRDINAANVTAQSRAAYLSYPVSAVTPDMAVYRGGLVVAGGNEVTVLSGSGKQTLSEGVSYAHPCVRAADKYFLTFGRGETGFAVYNAFGRMYSERTEFPIYDACMGDNGAFAVVTRSRDYRSEVVLYDGDMNKLVNCHLNGYVTALDANPTGDVTAVLSAQVANGVFETKLTLIRVGDRVSTKEVLLPDTFVGQAAFLSDDRLALVCRDRLLILNAEGGTVAEAAANGAEPLLCAFGSGEVALLCEDPTNLSHTLLRVYDRNGRAAYEISLPAVSGASTMIFNGGDVYLLTSDAVWRMGNGGRRVETLSVGRNVLSLLDAGKETPLLCAPAHAYHLKSEDFSPVN